MSNYKEITVNCPKCGAPGKFIVWSSVNVDVTPNLKEKVMSGELFKWTCPDCGETISIAYPILYHDVRKQIMVYNLLEREDKKQEPDSLDKIAKDFMHKIASSNFSNSGYMLRYTYSIDDFREKIAQLDSGLNDRIIEFLKYYLLHLHKTDNVPEGAELRFARATEDSNTGGLYLLFYIVHPSLPNQPFLRVPSNVYHEIERSEGNLDIIFGNQGTDWSEVSQFIVNEKLGEER